MASDVRELRGRVAIVGASESDEIGVLPDKSALTLHAEAARNALNDAGLTIVDVDGLFTAGVTSVQLASTSASCLDTATALMSADARSLCMWNTPCLPSVRVS